MRRSFTTLLKIWAQASDSTVRKGTKHVRAGRKGNLSHYIDQCKTDLSSPGKHLHELRKKTLLWENIRNRQPSFESIQPLFEKNPKIEQPVERKMKDPPILSNPQTALDIHDTEMKTPPRNPTDIDHSPCDSPAELSVIGKLLKQDRIAADEAAAP